MYNASTALRQSIAQSYTTFFFNLPLALVFSPSQFAVHSQFNLLFQFWIHTGKAHCTFGIGERKSFGSYSVLTNT